MNSQDSNDFSLILASSVHDMKNSLGMLLHSLAEILDEMTPEESRQLTRFATLQYEASRINTELIQLLAIYRMQNDHMPMHQEECYVVEIIEDQVARNDMLFRTRELDVRIDCDEDLDWYMDAELIGGVLNNVMVNCARYSKTRLTITARIVDKQLEIVIAEDGDGYPDYMLSNPGLEPQKKVDFSRGNTHLGLYFAQQVAQMHVVGERQGFVTLENGGELGGGVFTLTLP